MPMHSEKSFIVQEKHRNPKRIRRNRPTHQISSIATIAIVIQNSINRHQLTASRSSTELHAPVNHTTRRNYWNVIMIWPWIDCLISYSVRMNSFKHSGKLNASTVSYHIILVSSSRHVGFYWSMKTTRQQIGQSTQKRSFENAFWIIRCRTNRP